MTNFAINLNSDFFNSVGKDALIGGKNGSGFDALLAKVLQEDSSIANNNQLQHNNNPLPFNMSLTENETSITLPNFSADAIAEVPVIQPTLLPAINQKVVINQETADKLAAIAVITALNARLQSKNVDNKAPETVLLNNETPINIIPVKLDSTASETTSTSTVQADSPSGTRSILSYDNRSDEEIRTEIKSTIRQVLKDMKISAPANQTSVNENIKITTDSTSIKLRESIFAIDNKGKIHLSNNIESPDTDVASTTVNTSNTDKNKKYEQKVEVIFSNIDAAESAGNNPTGIKNSFAQKNVSPINVNAYTENIASSIYGRQTQQNDLQQITTNIPTETMPIKSTVSQLTIINNEKNDSPVVNKTLSDEIVNNNEITIKTILPETEPKVTISNQTATKSAVTDNSYETTATNNQQTENITDKSIDIISNVKTSNESNVDNNPVINNIIKKEADARIVVDSNSNNSQSISKSDKNTDGITKFNDKSVIKTEASDFLPVLPEKINSVKQDSPVIDNINKTSTQDTDTKIFINNAAQQKDTKNLYTNMPAKEEIISVVSNINNPEDIITDFKIDTNSKNNNVTTSKNTLVPEDITHAEQILTGSVNTRTGNNNQKSDIDATAINIKNNFLNDNSEQGIPGSAVTAVNIQAAIPAHFPDMQSAVTTTNSNDVITTTETEQNGLPSTIPPHQEESVNKNNNVNTNTIINTINKKNEDAPANESIVNIVNEVVIPIAENKISSAVNSIDSSLAAIINNTTAATVINKSISQQLPQARIAVNNPIITDETSVEVKNNDVLTENIQPKTNITTSKQTIENDTQKINNNSFDTTLPGLNKISDQEILQNNFIPIKENIIELNPDAIENSNIVIPVLKNEIQNNNTINKTDNLEIAINNNISNQNTTNQHLIINEKDAVITNNISDVNNAINSAKIAISITSSDTMNNSVDNKSTDNENTSGLNIVKAITPDDFISLTDESNLNDFANIELKSQPAISTININNHHVNSTAKLSETESPEPEKVVAANNAEIMPDEEDNHEIINTTQSHKNSNVRTEDLLSVIVPSQHPNIINNNTDQQEMKKTTLVSNIQPEQKQTTTMQDVVISDNIILEKSTPLTKSDIDSNTENLETQITVNKNHTQLTSGVQTVVNNVNQPENPIIITENPMQIASGTQTIVNNTQHIEIPTVDIENPLPMTTKTQTVDNNIHQSENTTVVTKNPMQIASGTQTIVNNTLQTEIPTVDVENPLPMTAKTQTLDNNIHQSENTTVVTKNPMQIASGTQTIVNNTLQAEIPTVDVENPLPMTAKTQTVDNNIHQSENLTVVTENTIQTASGTQTIVNNILQAEIPTVDIENPLPMKSGTQTAVSNVHQPENATLVTENPIQMTSIKQMSTDTSQHHDNNISDESNNKSITDKNTTEDSTEINNNVIHTQNLNTGTAIKTEPESIIPVNQKIISTDKTENKTIRHNEPFEVKQSNTADNQEYIQTTDINKNAEDNIITTPINQQQQNAGVGTISAPIIIKNEPVVNAQNNQVAPAQRTEDITVSRETKSNRHNNIVNNNIEISSNSNTQNVNNNIPVTDHKLAMVQRIQQMLNNTLAQAVQIIQTIPVRQQMVQQPIMLTSDFLTEADLFVENEDSIIRDTPRTSISLDEPIIDFKPGKSLINRVLPVVEKNTGDLTQQSLTSKSTIVISQQMAINNVNNTLQDTNEQKNEKYIQFSTIISNNAVNNSVINDDNNSKVINVNPVRIIEQIAKNVQPVKKGGKQEIILRLDPPTLGEIKVRISSDQNGIVTANIEAAHSSVRDSLAAKVPELRQALQDAGLSLDKCQVSLSSDRGFTDQFTNQPGNGRWQNEHRQQSNYQEALNNMHQDIPLETTEEIIPETATMNYLV